MTETDLTTSATTGGDADLPAGSLLAPPDATGRFGEFGGRFVPETLVPACEELEAAFIEAWADPAFRLDLRNDPERLRGPAVDPHRVPQPRA